MKILYVNHTARISGGEHSLLTLLEALPAGAEPSLACPAGELADAAGALGIPTFPLYGTAGSLRIHPLHSSRAIAELALAGRQVRRHARRLDAQVIHANSVRSGLITALAGRSAAARIVHVRDCLPQGRLAALSHRLIASTADLVIANSAYTAGNVRMHARPLAIAVLHNPIDIARFDRDRLDPAAVRNELGPIADGGLLLGVVAQITPWKGQDLAIEALAAVRRQGVDARLLIIGEEVFTAKATRFDNRAYSAALRERVRALRLQSQVAFLGRRDDVPALMSALDALLAPSWEEPFGRSIAEAMALAVPVLATNRGGPAELIVDGSDGILLDPRDAEAWAAAIASLAADPAAAREMGLSARAAAIGRLAPQQHVEQLLELYRGVCAMPAPAGLGVTPEATRG